MNYLKSITKEAINILPAHEFEGKILVIEDDAQAVDVARALAGEKLLGFDTETRPSFSKGQSYQVALLQLATVDGVAYLFRLNKIKLVPELLSLLTDENIIKTGVGITDDLEALKKMRSFEPRGFIDLAKEAEKRGFQNFGLRALTAIFLGTRLLKGAKLTNWNQPQLTAAQINYAANDAMVGLKIYQKLININ